MSFESPLWLLLIVLIPLGVMAYRELQRRKMRYAVAFTNVDMLADVARRSNPWRRRIPPLLFCLALVALAMGLARPEVMKRVPRDEATIALTIDVSGSMQAEDVEPNRLEAARIAATSFVNSLPPRFQVALVTFNQIAEVLAQPSIDRQAVLESIAALRAEGGTAMGMALAQSLELVRPDRADASGAPTPPVAPTPPPTPSAPLETRRVSAILLLSDGYNTSGPVSPTEAAQRAQEAGVPVYTIALGTPDGFIQVPDQFGNPRYVRVPPDFETLQRVAEITDGEYFAAPTDEDLQRVYDDLGEKIGFRLEPEEVTYAFAGGAAVLLIAAAALSILMRGRLP